MAKIECLRIIKIVLEMLEHRKDPLFINMASFRGLVDYFFEYYKTSPLYGRSTIITTIQELAEMLNIQPAMKHNPLLPALKLVYCAIYNYINIGHNMSRN